MSHCNARKDRRNRRDTPSKAAARSSRAGVSPIKASRAFFRENVRLIAFFMGIGYWIQVLVPWTTRTADNWFFVVVGSVLLGLAVPRRLWR